MTSVLAISKRTAISYAFVTWKLWVLYKEHVIYARAGRLGYSWVTGILSAQK